MLGLCAWGDVFALSKTEFGGMWLKSFGIARGATSVPGFKNETYYRVGIPA